MKFSTYEDWKHCITQRCGIPLAPDYIESRISELKDPKNYHTQKFVDVWGEAHLKRVIGWFEQAKKEFST
ncbi:MAG: hypothetical protein MI743_03120 [Sneathiellales bacterium]|nr:hypothetical protein [Sneathiellales bacterium]